MRDARTRDTDGPVTPIGWLLKHAKDIIAVVVLAGMMVAGMNHFATAGDVEKKFNQVGVDMSQKFNQISIQYKAGRLEDRKKAVEDKLDDLRETPDSRMRNVGRIKRLETELDDLSAKIRNLERGER